MHRTGLAVALVGVLLSGCGSSNDEPLPTGTLRFEGSSGPATVQVQIAETGVARAKGLMGRRTLGEDTGMVFLFDQPTNVGFWMKDTHIPLDIAYWDAGGRIVAIRHMVPCTADPCPLYIPGQDYVGAVEVNLGWFSGHGVKPGDRVRLLRGSG